MFISELIGALLQLILFAIVPLVFWLITARKKVNFFEWAGFKKVKLEGSLWQTLLLTVVITGIYIILSTALTARFSEGLTKAGSEFAGKGFAALPAVVVYAFIRTGLSEELLFRGFFLKRIASRFGFAAGNTIQALLFGALHGIPFGIATQSVVVAIVMTLLPGGFGWFEGFLNEKKCGGSIIPSWIIHGTLNTIVAALAL